MIAINLIYTFSCIAIFAIAMQCCWKKVSASQFTLYMTIANLGQMSFAALVGPVKANFDWDTSLFAFAVFITLAVLLLQFFNIEKHIQLVAGLETGEIRNKK
jgi:PAT family beta-lactamase induction signal transducer AmpG